MEFLRLFLKASSVLHQKCELLTAEISEHSTLSNAKAVYKILLLPIENNDKMADPSC
jgi:hypothetical protein